MKKWMIIAMVAVMVFSLAGCSSSGATESEVVLALEGDGGVLTCLDVETSPLDGGLLITVDTNEKIVNMQVTDAEGQETMEFYRFLPEEKSCERYRHVPMMGTGFYYLYDYENGSLLQVLDKDREDKTQSTMDSGRFEGAQTETQEQVELLIAYFEDSFGMSLAEAVEQ